RSFDPSAWCRSRREACDCKAPSPEVPCPLGDGLSERERSALLVGVTRRAALGGSLVPPMPARRRLIRRGAERVASAPRGPVLRPRSSYGFARPPGLPPPPAPGARGAQRLTPSPILGCATGATAGRAGG